MTDTFKDILRRQQVWASGIKTKSGYVLNLNDNLFEPLSQESELEFRNAAGKELEGEKAKMKALHSSSALVCNFFDYWRSRDNVGVVAEACRVNPMYVKLRFERAYKKPIEIGGKKPHVDIEFTNERLKPVAIESKFTEPYYVTGKKSLKEAYVKTPGVWGCFSACDSLAKKIVEEKEVFKFLDAPQLLKHILGLKTEYGEGNFELIYLWFKSEGEEAREHETEIRRFKHYIVSDLKFNTITYQEVFQRLKSHRKEHQEYMNYIEKRYFSV